MLDLEDVVHNCHLIFRNIPGMLLGHTALI